MFVNHRCGAFRGQASDSLNKSRRSLGLHKTAAVDPSWPLSLRAGNGSSCPIPAVRYTRPDRLSRVVSGLSLVRPLARRLRRFWPFKRARSNREERRALQSVVAEANPTLAWQGVPPGGAPTERGAKRGCGKDHKDRSDPPT
jgi:hypothetical protein